MHPRETDLAAFWIKFYTYFRNESLDLPSVVFSRPICYE